MITFLLNKYTIWYYSIINYRLAHPISGESHHIIPKCMGGSNHISNKVRLTAREHYVCHRLLTKMTTGRSRGKMFLALNCFTKPLHGRHIFVNSRVIEQTRKEANHYLKIIRSGTATRPAGTYQHSDITKSKISNSSKGIVKRPAGFTHSPSTIELMRSNRKGKNLGSVPWNKGLEQNCPHCGKLVRGTLNRWHGDNCKFKNDEA